MRFSTFTGFRVAAGVLSLVGLLFSSGCGDGKVARYPVSGTVRVDGQPAEGAIIVFCPVETSAEAERLRPAGRTDSAGKFNLTSIDAEDGAPAGEYKVLVQWPVPTQRTSEQRGDRGGPRPADRLNGRYYNLEQSKLTATVQEQTNELPPFELQSK